jgi:hypothetical protein
METGRRAHRSEVSTVDSALFLAGALTAAAYFPRDDAREQEIPERHVGALQLILGREHMGRDCRRVVPDDLDRGEHVQ